MPDLTLSFDNHLERLVDEAAARGTRFRQDFPPDCVPIRAGRTVLPLDAWVFDLD
ncbi:MAG: hypothetical protein ACK4QW_03205 [Alphaproteobacteria bacterium]